jgi:hypothetical protein
LIPISEARMCLLRCRDGMGVIWTLCYLSDLLFPDEHSVQKLSRETIFAANPIQYRILWLKYW